MKRLPPALLLTCVIALIGCAAQPEHTDYTRYIQDMPLSVVVLPPLNESTQVGAPEAFLSTITVPLAERGYYVFPVALVQGMLRENGLPTSGEMHQVKPQRFRQVFNADAVLYITIKEWTNRYVVIDSTTSVRLHYNLVDTDTGELLWHREQLVQSSSNEGNNSGDPFGAIIFAAIHAGTNVDGHRERDLAIRANAMVIADQQHGMLVGKRHPDFDADQQKRKAEAATVAVASK